MALAKWYKIDFHTHTPESKCFPDKKVTPKEWLKSAKESGINAVVVSDHNSVGWISKIEEVKSEFEDENFKVFYGIELCVSSDFTHFLIIFDDKMSVTEIEDAVVSNLGLLRKDWADTTINVSEDRLKTLCTELREKIFVIPAHFASNKGLGKSAENAIKKYQEFLLFSAVEVRNEEDVREYNNKLKNKAINKAVLITGSDNPSNRDEAQHSIEGFGKMFTWIKLSTLSFEGLRQVFIDPEHRCINWLSLQKIGVQFDPNETTYNYISGIAFEGISHMTKMNMRFSPNLNCIVGGRGTGKSTIVDAINYGVCNEHDLSKCRLLEKTLTKDAKISTYFNFGSNKPYVIKASRKGKQIVTDVEDNNGSVENPPEFKIDFYGQKEIFNLIDEDDNIANQTMSPLVKIHRKYLNALDEVKNTGGEDINAIQDQLQKNKKRYDDLMSLQNEQGNIEKKIEESIDNFIDKRIELSKKRQAVIDNLKLENISIKVIPLGHLARWKANLQKEFGKEGTFDNDFQNLADKVLSKDNSWEQYRAFLKFMLITDSGNVEKFLNCSTDTRFAKLWTDKYNNDTLSSMIKVLPEDKLQIKIIDENGEIDINEGSPGQKSAAILAFILNSGENPLIIDQPEDDLDNSLIYSLVVKSIRKMKSKRQIIIVTHNPNIPVLGDAEGIIVLERNNQGKVTFRKGKKAGCIEEKLIREGICEIMEGGEDAFRKRERKYQYN